MNTTRAQQTAYEKAVEMGVAEGTRYYLERLAFTRRGNFSLLLGMIFIIFDYVSNIASDGAGYVEGSDVLGVNNLLTESVIAGLDGAVTVLLVVLAGLTVLMMLDVYENEIGLSIEAEH